MSERPKLNMGLDEGDTDIAQFHTKPSKPKKKQVNSATVKEVAEQSGFTSREPKQRRRRTKRSPHTLQKTIRARPEVVAIYESVAETLDEYDYMLFEMALLALLEKKKMKEDVKALKKIIGA